MPVSRPLVQRASSAKMPCRIRPQRNEALKVGLESKSKPQNSMESIELYGIISLHTGGERPERFITGVKMGAHRIQVQIRRKGNRYRSQTRYSKPSKLRSSLMFHRTCVPSPVCSRAARRNLPKPFRANAVVMPPAEMRLAVAKSAKILVLAWRRG